MIPFTPGTDSTCHPDPPEHPLQKAVEHLEQLLGEDEDDGEDTPAVHTIRKKPRS